MASDGGDGARGPGVQIVLRPVGTPIALGMGALIVASVMLAGLQLGWLSGTTEQRTVAFVALVAAFPLEILAAIFAFLARDALAATGLGVFASVWSVSGLTLLTGTPGATNDALGMFQLLGALVLLLLLLAAGKGRLVLGAMIGCGVARLGLTGLYELTDSGGLAHAAGIMGLVLGAVCAYALVALLMEDLPRRAWLPMGRTGKAAAALRGGMEEQVDELEHEAGIRRQL